MHYLVRALDTNQQIQTLVLEALDEQDAHEQAKLQKLTPLSISQQRGFGVSRRTRFALLLFAQELHSLLAAGLSIIESLDTLIEKTPQVEQRAILKRIADQLREGKRLSAALHLQPEVFPPLFVGVVQAAEGTSDLPRALARYLDYETRLQSVRHKVVSAAIYPAILLAVGMTVSVFLLGYVVPKFASVYQNSSRTLPWASRMLMSWGQFAGTHANILFGVFLVGSCLAFWWVRRNLAAGGWWRMLKVLPGAGPKVEVLGLSRLYLTLGMLLEGGIPLHQALKLCTAVVDPADQDRLEAVRKSIETGNRLSDALEHQGLSTPVAQRLLRVGEQSGQLGIMLSRTANFYDEDTARWIERFSKAFEPALMTAIGLVIGLIVILLYMPIFELAGSLQ